MMVSSRVPVRTSAALSSAGDRTVAEEVAVAISYNGTTQAVLMATPADLADLARGFTVTEGFAAAADITDISVVTTGIGIDVQVWLNDAPAERLAARRRAMTGPVGCGLCGIDSLQAALRDVPAITAPLRLSASDIQTAVTALRGHQPLHDATHAAHAAGLYQPGAGIVAVREDVGRHNALDKLVGAGLGAAPGLVVMTSRLSVDLVQKVAQWGMPALVGASAPTRAAIDLAEQANITLIGSARPDRFDIYTHARRVFQNEVSHVA
jgi:FdhD protein